MKNKYSIGLLVVALGLVACGGGGSPSEPTTSAAPVPAPLTVSVATSATNTVSATGSTQTVSAANNQTGCSIVYAETATLESLGPDPLLANLWHLKNTGQLNGVPGEDLNIEAAWALSLGSNITIALIDDAFETVHPDLNKNINASQGLDYRTRTSASALPTVGSGSPCYATDNHGTSVAGIIAARYQNGIGTVGVAPNAKMVGYAAIETRFDDAPTNALTRDLHSNDIYNNSWGSPDNGELWFAEDAFAAAIAQGIAEGRQKRGAIYIFPSGNGGCALRDTQGRCQTELASYDGYLNEMGLIVVSALDRFGRRPSYSEPGPNILVSAPGGDTTLGITTTALKGNYSSSFAGTSAAAPMVSGVAALMLSVNSNLTWRDVRLILARTARANDSTQAYWQPAGANGGYRFNPFYGFGAVDALAAVKMALAWRSVGGKESLIRCEVDAPQTKDIPDDGLALTANFDFGPTCAISAIEHLELVIDVSHEYSGDLDIRVVSPSNTTSQFTETRVCGAFERKSDECGAYTDWRAASVRHLDEPQLGLWHLELRDRSPGKIGNLNRARLVVYGR
jgi:Subtilase family/Proprotein convertase P-domain